MKQPKKPTREQKKVMSENGLDWKKYNVTDVDNISFTAVHKKTGKREVLLC